PRPRAPAALAGASPADRFCNFVSPSFDMSLEDILTPLMIGATLVLHGADLWGPTEIIDRLAEHVVTWINLPAALWARRVREHGEKPLPPDRALRQALLGWEA